ncbi:hypothetical protein OAT84_03360 [Gammaproteobacteria bacterium]|nr:hypothetical protein [Gammaproteobacteria bacterium]
MSLTTIQTPYSPLLQRLVTQNLGHPSPQLACLCNRFGKVILRLWINTIKQTSFLHIENASLEKLRKHIQHYDIHQEIDLSHKIQTNLQDLGLHEKTPIEQQLIQQCIINITPDIAGKYTPHVLQLAKRAVDFSKGCFIGHEPIARTEFKGRIKKQLKYICGNTLDTDAINYFFDGQQYHMLTICPILL